MQIEPWISARSAATLIVRLLSPKLSPVAEAAARKERSVRRVLLQAVQVARDVVPMGELAQVLGLRTGYGAPLYVMQLALQTLIDELMGYSATLTAQHHTYVKVLEAKKKDLPDVLHETMQVGARVAAKPLSMAFDAANPVAIAWAHAHAAEMVQDLSDTAQDAIRLMVVDSIESGIAPRDMARLLRSGIGLTERDARAVMKRQLQWLADGVDPVLATKRAERYADKLLRARAETIARTETMRAANEGQEQLWQQAIEKGLLDPATAMKVWLTADPCPRCAPLDGETAPLNGDFSVGQDPPLHPRCRCTIGLVQ